MNDEHPLQARVGDALIMVDVQRDFLPGGALAVAEGDQVVQPLNRYAELFASRGLPVFASRDWHPAEHSSFADQRGTWPPHCVQGTPGAEFASDLKLPPNAQIISKATEPESDAYSAFSGTELGELLRRAGVQRLFVGGLATDYCVLETVRDARRLGYAVVLLVDAIRAVDRHPGDGRAALDEMQRLGAVAGCWEDIGGCAD